MQATELLNRYLPLLGKYVCLERPADEVEVLDARASGYDLETFGGQGMVAKVVSGGERLGGQSVEIIFDYGMGVLITEIDEHEWEITAWASEEVAVVFGEALAKRADYRERQVAAAAEAMADSLTMLGVNPGERAEHDSRTTAEILASMALRAVHI